jgi:hypothetical protein
MFRINGAKLTGHRQPAPLFGSYPPSSDWNPASRRFHTLFNIKTRGEALDFFRKLINNENHYQIPLGAI